MKMFDFYKENAKDVKSVVGRGVVSVLLIGGGIGILTAALTLGGSMAPLALISLPFGFGGICLGAETAGTISPTLARIRAKKPSAPEA